MEINYLLALLTLAYSFLFLLLLYKRGTTPSLGISWYASAYSLALLFQGLMLYRVIDTPNGQNLSWPTMFAFTSWLVNLFSYLFSRGKMLENIHLLSYPLTMASLGLLHFGSAQAAIFSHPPLPVLLHIFSALVSLSLLMLATLHALLLGLQNYLLKQHSPWLRHFSALQANENTLFLLIKCSSLGLSLTLLSALLVYQLDNSNHLLSKTLLTLSAWLGLLLLLIGRKFFGWRAFTAIRWTLGSTLLILGAYFGLKIFY